MSDKGAEAMRKDEIEEYRKKMKRKIKNLLKNEKLPDYSRKTLEEFYSDISRATEEEIRIFMEIEKTIEQYASNMKRACRDGSEEEKVHRYIW